MEGKEEKGKNKNKGVSNSPWKLAIEGSIWLSTIILGSTKRKRGDFKDPYLIFNGKLAMICQGTLDGNQDKSNTSRWLLIRD